MKIPKKINPDRIKDSIIEIRYTSKLPFEILLGIFFGALDDSFTYSGNPLIEQQIPTSFRVGELPEEVKLSLGNQHLFYNDKIKIQFQPKSIIFNCLHEYILWDNYKGQIENVLSQLHSTNLIDQYNRIGVRYISQYPDYDLQDIIKFSFTFGMPNIQSDTYRFRSEFMWDSLRVILNLSNKSPVLTQEDVNFPPSIVKVSLIDIDVILDGFIESQLDKLIEKLVQTQLKEKEVFFNLLKESYLESLKPEY